MRSGDPPLLPAQGGLWEGSASSSGEYSPPTVPALTPALQLPGTCGNMSRYQHDQAPLVTPTCSLDPCQLLSLSTSCRASVTSLFPLAALCGLLPTLWLAVTGPRAYLCSQEALWPGPGRPGLWGNLASHLCGHVAPPPAARWGWGKAATGFCTRPGLAGEASPASGPPGL